MYVDVMSVFAKCNLIISMHTCEQHGSCVFYVSVSVHMYLCLRCARIIQTYAPIFVTGAHCRCACDACHLSAGGLERIHECLPSPQSHHSYTSVPLLVPLTPIYIISYLSITARFGLRGMVAKTSVGDAAPVSRSVS